jgi:(R,R)-butanediol dehydrogenase / meso-butanediol dehydrogenase / diacetyl reductase
MRAVRLHGIGDLRFDENVRLSALAPDHVRVRVHAAGICGSDLHNFRTGQWMGRLPIIPGHEFSGEIIAIGREVGDWMPGRWVVGDSRVNCGECACCREGRPNVCVRMGYVGEVCDGAFAESIDLPAARLLAVPAGVSLRVAALTEPLGVALRVVRRLDPARGAPIVIAGAGPIGGLTAILLAHLGFGPVAVIDRNVVRARLVASVCGARVIAATAAEIAEFAGSGGLRYAIEATGSSALLSLLVGNLQGGGRLAMVGLFEGQQTWSVNAIVERELEIRGCSVFCDEQREVLPLLPELMACLERVISPGVSLERLPAEYARLAAGESEFLKTIVQP